MCELLYIHVSNHFIAHEGSRDVCITITVCGLYAIQVGNRVLPRVVLLIKA